MNGKDEPPDIPTGLKAEIVTDNASQVRLSWNENTDPDIRGYNIYVNGVLKEKCVKDTFYTFIAKAPVHIHLKFPPLIMPGMSLLEEIR